MIRQVERWVGSDPTGCPAGEYGGATLPLLRYKEDRRTVFFLAVAVVLYAGSLCLRVSSLALWQLGLAGLVLCGTSFVACVINHNQRHAPIFRTAQANHAVNCALSVLMGSPSARLHQVHLSNHHRYFRDTRDWTCYKSVARGTGWRRSLTYMVQAARTIQAHRRELQGNHPALDRALLWERRILYPTALVCLVLNPRVVLLLWLPAWMGALGLLLLANLLNHDECELESELDHSRDFLSRAENWLLFNNGFHTAHHLRPHLHWSELPVMHARVVAPGKDPRFVRGSMLAFFLRGLW